MKLTIIQSGSNVMLQNLRNSWNFLNSINATNAYLLDGCCYLGATVWHFIFLRHVTHSLYLFLFLLLIMLIFFFFQTKRNVESMREKKPWIIMLLLLWKNVLCINLPINNTSHHKHIKKRRIQGHNSFVKRKWHLRNTSNEKIRLLPLQSNCLCSSSFGFF